MRTISDIHVLIVDDNRQMRFLLRSLLRAAGIGRVSEASNAAQAFDVMTMWPVDLVLVDWKMRPTDGLTFTRMIRHASNSPNPHVTILMLTAHTEASRVAAARDAGVSGFLKKPISAQLLFDRIGGALTDSRVFVRTHDFFGPDRRFGATAGYCGPFRRATDRAGAGEMIDLDDEAMRWSA
ncbi:MAG: response regulator [Hyphomonadaceae bacterium]